MSIIVTNELEGLKVYHYENCNNDSEDDLKAVRGIIKSNQTVCCKSFGFTPEILSSDTEGLEKHVLSVLNDKNEKYTFFESHEGSLLRLWYDSINNKWRLSTHRKIDAFYSKWGSNTTYGEMFTSILHSDKNQNNFISKQSWADDENSDDENGNISKQNQDIFDVFTSTCEKHLVYVFLIRNTDNNRVVVRGYTEPKMFCLGTFNSKTNFSYSPPSKKFTYQYPPLYNFTTLDNCIQDISNVDIFKLQGYTLITQNGKMIKIVNPTYDEYFKCRNNVPNIEFRYIECRNDPHNLSLLKECYPEYTSTFNDVETILSSITTNVYKKYLTRYIYKNVALLPPPQLNILKNLHTRFINKEFTRISHEIVSNTIKSLSVKELYYLIKNYKINKTEYGNGNYISKELKDKIMNSIA